MATHYGVHCAFAVIIWYALEPHGYEDMKDDLWQTNTFAQPAFELIELLAFT